MALQTSGAISLANIQTEFGGSNPISLSEYYGGGTYVPAGANPGIATSGAINMNSFYGGVAATVLTISSNVNNYDIGARAIAAGGDKSTPVILTINAGVTVGSTSSSTAAMYTGTGWSNGTTINITNNGSISGASGSNATGAGGIGGNGGSGGSGGNGGSGGSGSTGSGSASSVCNGGNAFEHSQTGSYLSVIFDTAGTRSGGGAGTTTFQGGGGGGGGGGTAMIGHDGGGAGIGGCGGGGGARSGSGGSGGSYGTSTPGGSSGGTTSGGSGGSMSNLPGYNYGYIASGGNGGNLGSSGSSGQRGTFYYNNATWGSGGSGGSSGSNGSTSGSSGSALAGNTGQIS